MASHDFCTSLYCYQCSLENRRDSLTRELSNVADVRKQGLALLDKYGADNSALLFVCQAETDTIKAQLSTAEEDTRAMIAEARKRT